MLSQLFLITATGTKDTFYEALPQNIGEYPGESIMNVAAPPIANT